MMSVPIRAERLVPRRFTHDGIKSWARVVFQDLPHLNQVIS